MTYKPNKNREYNTLIPPQPAKCRYRGDVFIVTSVHTKQTNKNKHTESTNKANNQMNQ